MLCYDHTYSDKLIDNIQLVVDCRVVQSHEAFHANKEQAKEHSRTDKCARTRRKKRETETEREEREERERERKKKERRKSDLPASSTAMMDMPLSKSILVISLFAAVLCLHLRQIARSCRKRRKTELPLCVRVCVCSMNVCV